MLNWNLKDLTIECVESLLDAGVKKQHIVVVDNGSSDDSVAGIRAHFGPELNLIENEVNVGFTGGMNIGIRFSLEKGAVSVLLLNNDTVVAPDMIELLAEAGAGDPQRGILGPAIYYYDQPDRLWWLGDIEHPWLPMPRPVRMEKEALEKSLPFKADYVTGCAMLVDRKVFEHIGLLDERYFIYYEDADFCRRARDAGFTIYCVPQAKMWHKVSLTTKRDKPFFHHLRAKNQVRFYHEHRIGPSNLLRETYILAKIAWMMLEDMIHGDWKLIAPVCKGMIDGYKEQCERRHALNARSQMPPAGGK